MLKVLTWGATWHALELVDKTGMPRDVVVAPKTFSGYLKQSKTRPYFFGNSIGRYAGRLSNPKIRVNNQEIELKLNDGVHLHGGENSPRNKVWEIVNVNSGNNPSVTLAYESPHLEEGYLGNVSINVKYTLGEDDRVQLHYEATTDTETIINLTNHTYFNLDGESVGNHVLQVQSSSILDTDRKLIPTGKIIVTEGTPYDFQDRKKISQIKGIGELDTCFILEKVKPQIKLFAEQSGIELEIESNQPAAVIFCPKDIAFAEEPKNVQWVQQAYPAVCFELQNYPDAPQHSHFPSCLLRENETYQNKTAYNFKVQEG